MTVDDLKGRLEAELNLLPGVPPPPVTTLRNKIARRRRRRGIFAGGTVVIAVAIASIAILTAGRGGASRVQVDQQRPVSAAPPPTQLGTSGPVLVDPPNTASVNCAYPSALSTDTPLSSTTPLVTVDPNPTGVTAIWNPGVNAEPCRVQISSGDTTLARQLASAILDQPPTYTISCGVNFSGVNVSLYFTYAHQAKEELVLKELDGCRWLFAPARASRFGGCDPGVVCTAKKINQLLASIAPPAYQTWLSGS